MEKKNTLTLLLFLFGIGFCIFLLRINYQNKYYDNGKLMQEAPYVNDELDGIAKWYDQEGNLSIAYRYADGELVDKDPELD